MGELVLKELHDHLLSLRFQAGFLLALVLVSASAFVLSSNYQRDNAEYVQRLRQEDDFLRRYAHLNRLGGVLTARRPPAAMALVRGLANEAGMETLDSDPMLEMFPPMDLPAVVAIIFSLFGIVLGFDAINGERERGTLRLVLANPVRRFELLAAKWAGGMLVLAAAFVAAVLAGAGIVLARSGAHWSREEWLAFAGVCAASLVYCGAFYSLALMFSALARRSSVSVLASVFGWVLLVLVIPNVSPYVAAQFAPLPSAAAMERDQRYITSEERDELGRAGQRKVQEKYRGRFEFGDVASEEARRRIAADPAQRRLYQQMRNEIEAVWAEVNRRQREKAMRLQETYQDRTKRQFELSRWISYASPLPPLLYASTELAATGFESQERFRAQARAYGSGLGQYVRRRYKEEQSKNPAFGVNDFLDVSGRPRFEYAPPPFADRLAVAQRFFAMLAGWNAALFLGAVLAFLRFDVR
ncbi:MAG: ABC transporter permease subunit [Acidobacteriota bacterium]